MSEQKKIWMVRLGDHVCGPYETLAIESLIQQQKITEIDEIALPCKGWEYIRDRGEFLDLLDDIRSNSFNRSAGPSGTPETPVSGTENITQIEAHDRTEELDHEAPTEDTKTLPIVNFGELAIDQKSGRRLKPFGEAVSFGEKKSKKKLIAVACLIVAGAATFFKSQGYNPSKMINMVSQEDFNEAWQAGDYSKSLQILKSKESLKNKNRLHYAAALLMKRNEFSGAEQILEASKDKDSSKWKNLKGLSSQYSDELDVAESNYLSVLKKDSNYIPSLVNLGFIHRNAGEWSEARSYFESAFAKADSKGFDGVAFYLLESWMRQSLADTGLTNLDNVNTYLQNQMIGLSTYKHEFKLVELWISTIKRRWPVKEDVLTKALLELDPAILLERVVNPYLYRLQSGGLSYLCNDLEQKLKETKYKKAVIGLCSIVDKEYDKAAQILAAAPQNEYVLTLRSFVAEIQEKPEMANEHLSAAMETRTDDSPTKFFFQARFCFRKGDMKCSAEYWMKALEKHPDSYTALTGLGQSYFQVEDYDKAKRFAKRSAEFVESYGPLIDLQTRLKKVN